MQQILFNFRYSTLSRAVAVIAGGLAISSLVAPPHSWAQSAPDAQKVEAADKASKETVVVTGRAGSGIRTKLNTSYSITAINEDAMRMQGATSVTESLKTVPGFWVEATGGEGSGNIRARGIPVDGFGSVTLLEDGIPIQHDPALGYLNVDQAFRIDETIDRIEVVRGGPSSILYSNAPAGAINFRSRELEGVKAGIAKVTLGNFGLLRTDFFYANPLSEGWGVSLGGFYRSSDGVRNPGFKPEEGGQVRIRLSKDLDGGRVTFDLKHMDDRVPFYLGIPMRTYADGSIKAVPGFDGNYGTIAGPQTQFLAMKTPTGTYNFDNTEGTHVKRDQVNFKVEKDIDGVRVEESLRVSKTETTRNGVFPNQLISTASFLNANIGNLSRVPGAVGLGLRYANAPGSTFADPNGLMVVGGLRGLTLPIDETVNDLRMSKSVSFGAQKHDLTAGIYYAHFKQGINRYSSTMLLGATSNAPVVDLVGVDATGKVLGSVTDNGVYRYGYEWANASGKSATSAVYLLDEWQVSPALRIDAGVRHESVNLAGSTEKSTTVNGGTFATSAMLTGTGVFDTYDKTFSKTGWTVGSNFQLNPNSGVFGRWTQAFRMPNLGSFITSPTATPITQTMELAEVGYKFQSGDLALYPTLFYTKFHNVSYTNYVFSLDNSTSTAQTGYASTKALGLEFEGRYTFSNWLDLTAVATLQNPQYEDLVYTDKVNNLPVVRNFRGNQLIRVPKSSYRLMPALNLMDNRLRLQLSYEFVGERFVDAANSVRLPKYTTLNFVGRFDASKQTSVYLNVDNLNNSQGLTEGNPRAGELQSADALANTFIARPLLGRALKVTLRHEF